MPKTRTAEAAPADALRAAAGPIAWEYFRKDDERYLRGMLAGNMRELCLAGLTTVEAKRLLAHDLRNECSSSKSSASR